MNCTLSELRDRVNCLIDQQGEDAPCAAFVFTREDVCVFEFEDDQEYHLEVEQLEEECPGIADTVLTELSGSDYIYNQCHEILDDEIRRVRVTS